MAGCASPGGCGDPQCYLCGGEFQQRFPPIAPCLTLVDQPRVGSPVLCRYFAGHPGPCAAPRKPWRDEHAALRESGERPDPLRRVGHR